MCLSYNPFLNILRRFDDLPNFISPQVKRCVIITYKYEIYNLSHESPNELGNNRKVSKPHRRIA